MATKWSLTGTYFETCNCEAACPCVFLSPPTTGECTVLIGWHIEKGHLDAVALDGLNVALAVYSPGHMARVQWKAALYFDNQATEAQNTALTQIFTGQVGGHPGMLVSHVGEVLGIASAAIDYQAEGKQRRLQISGVAEAEILAVSGQGGAEITINNHPLCIAPGYPAVQAKSQRLSYRDHGMQWELSGKNGFYSPFTYQA
ncbi:MAG: DUF1326 domain-containing protein [Candidatus Binatia bacterium]